MSNKKLETTAGRYGSARYPSNLSLFQRVYETRRHKSHPVTPERLHRLSEDLKLIALNEKTSFDPNFTTDDGTRWIKVGFQYLTGNKYIFAFPAEEDPKHHDGTVSEQHVALFSLDEEVSSEELNHVSQAAYAIFHTFNQ